IGDVHGCLDELVTLLRQLGYDVAADGERGGLSARPPEGRKAVFLGDLVDRGPDTPGVLRLVMNSTAAGNALCVPGNHDMKLMRKLRGRDVRITHGLAESLEQLAREPPEFKAAVVTFLDDLVSHYVLDDGRLVVAHAGLREEMQGRGSGKVRDFALFGETTGETDELGLPVRYDWASEYRGPSMVVYGHTPVELPEWVNRTINIDTGCVFGGGPRGDEPLRHRSPMARLPAAHDVAVGDEPGTRPARASARGVRLLPKQRRGARRPAGEAHGLARRARRVSRRGGRPPSLRGGR